VDRSVARVPAGKSKIQNIICRIGASIRTTDYGRNNAMTCQTEKNPVTETHTTANNSHLLSVITATLLMILT
ncbi:MAG TPA: hypothetical protein VL154_07005, partial [Acetobacteraceae bacterium]|nr:hypothetical protein [Acetobacteraceae bacterium]